MSGVEQFEDLIAWQKARELTASIYRLTRQPAFSRDYGLTNQIQRASVSVMLNIAEGFERSGPTEFHQFLSTAKASCGEVRSQLYVALHVGYLSQDQFGTAMSQAKEVSRVVGGLRASVERRKNAQRK